MSEGDSGGPGAAVWSWMEGGSASWVIMTKPDLIHVSFWPLHLALHEIVILFC